MKKFKLTVICVALAGMLAGCAGAPASAPSAAASSAASSEAASQAAESAPYSSVQPAEIEVKPSTGTTVTAPLGIPAEELVGSWAYTWNEKDDDGTEWEYISAVTFYDNGNFEYVIGLNDSDMADFVSGTYEYAPENGLKMHFKEFVDGIEETNSLLSETFTYKVEQSGEALQFSCDADGQHYWNDDVPFLTMAAHVRDEER